MALKKYEFEIQAPRSKFMAGLCLTTAALTSILMYFYCLKQNEWEGTLALLASYLFGFVAILTFLEFKHPLQISIRRDLLLIKSGAFFNMSTKTSNLNGIDTHARKITFKFRNNKTVRLTQRMNINAETRQQQLRNENQVTIAHTFNQNQLNAVLDAIEKCAPNQPNVEEPVQARTKHMQNPSQTKQKKLNQSKEQSERDTDRKKDLFDPGPDPDFFAISKKRWGWPIILGTLTWSAFDILNPWSPLLAYGAVFMGIVITLSTIHSHIIARPCIAILNNEVYFQMGGNSHARFHLENIESFVVQGTILHIAFLKLNEVKFNQEILRDSAKKRIEKSAWHMQISTLFSWEQTQELHDILEAYGGTKES